MPFRCTPPTKDPVATLAYRPWEIRIAPFQVAPQTWYVSGQTWVACYLIDTGDGLILIDTGIAESLYLLVDSIYRLGYRIDDIKKILLSHAHFDHSGGARAMKELTGAEIYMSKEDWEFMKACPEETIAIDKDSHPHPFVPDKFFSDDEPVTLGNISVKTMLMPGHTAGCTSFFWDVINPINGEVYTVGMHGGVGPATMTDKYYATSKFLTPDLRERFLNDAAMVRNIHVDIAIPSHLNQIDMTDQIGSYSDANQPYLDSTVWAEFVDERVRQVREIVK